MSGTILDLDEPLEGVIITMDGKTATTDAGGNFIMPDVLEARKGVSKKRCQEPFLDDF